MITDEVKRWIEIADKDLSEADFLLKNKRPLEDVAFFAQQAAEKYLKGFLINSGWELRKIHDLISLIGEAIKIDKKFEEFSQPFQMLTKYYFDGRYPVEYPIDFNEEEIRVSLVDVKKLADLIKNKIIS